MNSETRIQKIEAITKQGNPYGRQEIPWRDKLVAFDVYEIPLDCLVYNKYNGRILSRTLSLETQGQSIDPESVEGKTLIEKLLWESKEDRNRDTLKSLMELGQEKVGIITKDGIIIDGNRRAMLLNRGEKKFFKAIVLPVTLEDDRNSIEELETKHQMGEDKKLDYNPIEKYLKAWNLSKRGVTVIDIANWMGETEGKIKQLIAVKDLIDEYLSYLGYNGIYTQIIAGQEDLFISLNGWLQNLYGASSLKGFDGYTDGDVDDLKIIAFDYIRVKFGTEDKKFRKLANGLKENHLFGDKKIWKSFSNAHFEGIVTYHDNEPEIDRASKNLEAHLNARDEAFKVSAYSFLEQNFNDHLTQIGDRLAQDRPAELTAGALNKINNINPRKPLDTVAIKQLNQILATSKCLLGKKSPIDLFDDIIGDLKNIDLKTIGETGDAGLERIREINHLVYEIKKALGA